MKYQNAKVMGQLQKLVEKKIKQTRKEVTCKGLVVLMLMDFSTVTPEAKGQWNKAFPF